MDCFYHRTHAAKAAHWCFAFVLLVASLVVLGGQCEAFWGKSLTEVSANGNEVRITEKELTVTASYYKLFVQRDDGKNVEVRFFLVLDAKGEPHSALDACDSCWPAGKGYMQEGEFFRCENCDMRFNVSRIGHRKGGCNPHPLAFGRENGEVVISLEELRQGSRLFK